MEFPRLVYKGGPATHLLVQDEDQLEAALADDWFLTVPEAIRGVADVKPVEVDQADESNDNTRAPTRAEMEAKATELGIKFDGRTSDKKLLELITTKLEG